LSRNFQFRFYRQAILRDMKRSDVRVAQKWNQKWSILYRLGSQTCAFIKCRVRRCRRGRWLKRRLGESQPFSSQTASRHVARAFEDGPADARRGAWQWLFISLNGVAARDLIRSRVPAIECPTRRILLRTFATSLTKALAGDPRLHGAAGVSRVC
jgi:hypothetical protein